MKNSKRIFEFKVNLKYYFFYFKIILFLIPFFFLNKISLYTQWEPCNNGLPYCEANCFLKDSNYTFVGIDCGVYITSNNGDYWIPKNNGLIKYDGLPFDITSLVIKDNYIFAGTSENGIFISTNDGDSWMKKSNGLPFDTLSINSPNPGRICSIVKKGNEIFAINSFWGLYLSTDNGEHWIEKINGLIPDTCNWDISSIGIIDNNIFIGGSIRGIFFSSNNGENWIPKNNGLTNLEVSSLAIKGNDIYACTSDGLFLSKDNGDNWKCIGFSGLWVASIYIENNNIFIGGPGIYVSTDNGSNWFEKDSGISNDVLISSLLINGDYIFGASIFHGLFRAKLSDLGITDVKEKNYNNSKLEIYPNPASSSVSVKYESTNYSKLEISIFDLLGNEVFNTSEDCNIGINVKTIDCQSLETGYYILRLKQGERVEAKPFLLIKN